MKKPSFSRGLTVTGPQTDSRGIDSYQITWDPAFFETPPAEADSQTWLRRQAWLGTGSLFFSYLRERFPSAFVLSNFASRPTEAQVLAEILGWAFVDRLSRLPSMAVGWDYGFGGRGAPVKGERAVLIELGDHNQILPALMGVAPVELSFVLILGPREMHLDRIRGLMSASEDPGAWEANLLSELALLGFPHEEAMYTIKTMNRTVKQVLGALPSEGPVHSSSD